MTPIHKVHNEKSDTRTYVNILTVTFILSSSGALATVPEPEPWPALLFCLYVFITPHIYADLLETCSKFESKNCVRTFNAPSTGNSFRASKARSSRSAWASLPEAYKYKRSTYIVHTCIINTNYTLLCYCPGPKQMNIKQRSLLVIIWRGKAMLF